MARRTKNEWVCIDVNDLSNKPPDLLQDGVLVMNKIKRREKKRKKEVKTFGGRRAEVLNISQAEMAKLIKHLYKEGGLKYIPPNQVAIARFELGQTYPNLKPIEDDIWAKAYKLSKAEYSRMIDLLPFPNK